MLRGVHLSLILFNSFCGIYSILKVSKHTAICLTIDNEVHYVTLLCLSSAFITYTPSFILGQFTFEKVPLGSQLIYLVTPILVSRTKSTFLFFYFVFYRFSGTINFFFEKNLIFLVTLLF